MIRNFLFIFLLLPLYIFAQDHILITEFVVTPTAGEFVEIHNPTSNTIDLSNYYLTDATFAGGSTYYYNIVTGSNAGGGTFGDFHARFPSGATIGAGEFQTIAMNGTDFVTTYSIQPTYELWNTDSNIPDMLEAILGSISDQGGLTNAGEVIILYVWDGQSDLVQDVDYVVWGDKIEAVDKTGVSIDGPDQGSDPSTYLDDTSIQNQISVSSADPHGGGESSQRNNLLENSETLSGGNGITGHDETSEDLATSFQVGSPNPGSGPGGGTAPSISNVAHQPAIPTSSDIVTVSADVIDDGMVTSVKLFYSIDSAPFDSTNMNLTSGNTYEATIAPQPDGTTVEYYIKAIDDEELASTSSIFSYTVGGPQITPIADIQANPSAYTTVTIQGTVTLGAGITTTSWTDVFVQDSSNAGINIYRSGTIDPDLVRGNLVQITGTVEEYTASGYTVSVTEIIDYTVTVLSTGNPVSNPVALTTQQANNTDLEGTFIQVTGEVIDKYDAGGGTTIIINDGSGDCQIRVWNTTGVDLSGIVVGDDIRVRGPMDIYQDETQILLGYQEDLEELTPQTGDGSGTATIDPDSVGLSEIVSETIMVQGESPYTLATVSVQVPNSWLWSGSGIDIQLSGAGFSGAIVDVQNKLITITNAAVTDVNTGTVTIGQLTSPANSEQSVFTVKTAIDGGTLTGISSSPRVIVGEGGSLTTSIAFIQQNFALFEDSVVTIEGIVTLGAGRTITSQTDAYVQDNSERGINIFSFDPPDPLLVRGNKVQITGTVIDYQGVTEITDYIIQLISTGNDLPEPLFLSTNDANNIELEGTYIRVKGITTSIEDFGTAANVTVDDGSGEVLVRVWATTGINLGFLSTGDSVIVTAVMDIYSNAAQLAPGYQDEVVEPGTGSAADGSGSASTSATNFAVSDTVSEFSVTIIGTTQDTLRSMQIDVPIFWQWSGLASDLTISKSGFQGATSQIQSEDGIIKVKIENIQVTLADSGVVTFKNMRTPADSINSVFWIRTAGENGKLRFISSSPIVTVGAGNRYWMYDLQTNSGNFVGNVTVRGVTTIGAGLLRVTSSGGIPLTTAYIQDESGRGLNLFQFDVLDTAIIKRDNYVEATGTVTEFDLVTEMEYTNLTLLGTVPRLTPEILKNREANSAKWDGTLIQTDGVVIDKYSAGGGTTIVISDGEGSTNIRIWDTANLDLSDIEVNKAIIVSGVGGVFISGNDTIYQILSVYDDQIELDLNYQPSLDDVFLKVDPYPFVPDRGEKIGITYNVGAVNNQATIRIFDLGGRLILTLLSEPATIIERRVLWDGRNKLRDLVPLGTYICHLEVVEQTSGDKKTAMAPIVVGTILKR